MLIALALAGLSGCLPGRTAPSLAPSDDEVAALEAEAARRPMDAALLLDLGTAYRSAGRIEDARLILERALTLAPEDPAAVLLLGLTYEDLELFADARGLYTKYLEVGTSRSLRARLRDRIPRVERQALRAQIRAVVADEAAVAGPAPDARNVAIFPFLYDGSNPDYAPLGRAIAELLATDLAQTDRVTVLERVRAQILVDELALGASGLIDPATAARGGYLLGAGRVVQGRISDTADQIRLDASIVDVGGGATERAVSDQDLLRGLFDLEKRIALAIYAALGIELTPTERERVNRRPTESLQALIEYGLGLQAEDADDYVEAARHFQRAAELDANFEAAGIRGAAAQQIADTTPITTAELTSLAAVETPPLPGIEAIQALVPLVGARDSGAEVLGNEGIGRPLILEVIIRRPEQ